MENSARQRILDWAEQGRIEPDNLRPALRIGRVLPGQQEWLVFLDRFLIGLGVSMLGAGVVFFFAYNWDALGRFAKFGLIEALIAGTLAGFWVTKPDSMMGRAVLLAASLLVGVLLALVGQTYQTGADTYELFLAWAVLIFPWVVLSRSAIQWLFWVLLLNLACSLYYFRFRGLFGFVIDDANLWALFALNTCIWAVWELSAKRGIQWLQKPWAIRVLAAVSAGLLTMLAITAIVDGGWREMFRPLSVWAVWMAVAYLVYRNLFLDVFILAAGVLSAVLVATTVAGRITLSGQHDAGGFLVTGMVVIILSGLGAKWLKQVVRQGSRHEA